jgi:hypothetical protein
MIPITQGGGTIPSGALSFQRTRDLGVLTRTRAPLTWRVANFLRHRIRGVPAQVATKYLGRLLGLIVIQSSLRLELHKADGSIVDYGVVGTRVLTTAGAGFIVDAFQNLVELEEMKYHGFGTGGAAEAVGNTALSTELTTEYVVNSTRPTGSTTEGASANIYRTVATLSPDSGGTLAITEHGVFSQAATGGGVLLDKTLFAAVNLAAPGDSLQATYELTITTGG